MKSITNKIVKELNLVEDYKSFIYNDTIRITKVKLKDKRFSIVFGLRNVKSGYAFNSIIEEYLKCYDDIIDFDYDEFIKDIKEFYNQVIELNKNLILTKEMIEERNSIVNECIEEFKDDEDMLKYLNRLLNSKEYDSLHFAQVFRRTNRAK